ncbi:MAG: acyl-CoA/acyl-ACP dehydrogenase [Actinobacteria bacterium]|nr:acyl-CoA/acyl-ACP dehydrogenase [Actinomycetota bacterium]
MDFSLPLEIDNLRSACDRLATERLRVEMREAETRRAWSEEALAGLRSLGISGLLVPRICAGDSNPLAAAVSLETIAGGDAGGLPLADQPGPASGALGFLAAFGEGFLGEQARRALAGCLEGRGHVGLSLVQDSAAATTVSWMPGNPDTLLAVCLVSPCTIRLVPRDSVSRITRAGIGAFHASGGISCEVGEGTEGSMSSPSFAVASRAVARLWLASVMMGIGQAALDHAISYGRDRIVFKVPVLAHQANAFEVARVTSALSSARGLLHAAATWLGNAFEVCYSALEVPGRAGALPEEAEASLVQASWMATASYREARTAVLSATDLGVQLLGGHGYMEDEPVEKLWREARMLALWLGGDDMALDDMATDVLYLGDPLVLEAAK